MNMYRHISVFKLENKEEIEELLAWLERVGKECPLIAASIVRKNISEAPGDGPGPDFGDVVQIVDFASKEDLDAYPASKEHVNLAMNGPKNSKVTVIDFQV